MIILKKFKSYNNKLSDDLLIENQISLDSNVEQINLEDQYCAFSVRKGI
ncbi:UNVERIFIED_CONTAM: hypothetical protein O8I53_09740 [Campylobacter lari]